MVYGSESMYDYPIDTGSNWFLYDDLLATAKVTRIPASAGNCPTRDPPAGQRYKNWPYHSLITQASGVWHPYPYAALPGNKWVEAMHEKDPFGTEHFGAWMLYAPGSGIYVWTGNTIAFPEHADAYAHFGIKAHDDHGDMNEAMSRAAAAKGYDTVQFLAHPDAVSYPCAERAGLAYMGLEIVAVKLAGVYSCMAKNPSIHVLRSGWKGQFACHCSNAMNYLNCHGFEVSVALNGSVVVV